MKFATRIGLAALSCSFIASHESHAAYLGLGCQLHTIVTLSGLQKSVYRLYGVFDNPNDHLSSFAGSQILGAMTIQTFTSTGELGGPFSNPVGGGNQAPTAKAIAANPDVEWDTFTAVGFAIDDDESSVGYPALSPGFPAEFGGQFIIGNTATTTNAAWFSPPTEDNRAGGPNGVKSSFINGSSAISGLGVLLAQFTVNAGEGVRGTGAVGMTLASGLAGGQSLADQTFSILVPAPGAMMILLTACAPFAPRRRRS
jgi:hypothetical protein